MINMISLVIYIRIQTQQIESNTIVLSYIFGKYFKTTTYSRMYVHDLYRTDDTYGNFFRLLFIL